MSWQAVDAVLNTEIPDAPRTADAPGCNGTTMKLVLVALANRARADGTNAHPGIRKLARAAQCHSSTVVRALARLRADGWITVERKSDGGLADVYRLNAVELSTDRAHLVRAVDDDPHARGVRASGARITVRQSYIHAADAADVSHGTCIECGAPSPDHRFRCDACQLIRFGSKPREANG